MFIVYFSCKVILVPYPDIPTSNDFFGEKIKTKNKWELKVVHNTKKLEEIEKYASC